MPWSIIIEYTFFAFLVSSSLSHFLLVLRLVNSETSYFFAVILSIFGRTLSLVKILANSTKICLTSHFSPSSRLLFANEKTNSVNSSASFSPILFNKLSTNFSTKRSVFISTSNWPGKSRSRLKFRMSLRLNLSMVIT